MTTCNTTIIIKRISKPQIQLKFHHRTMRIHSSNDPRRRCSFRGNGKTPVVTQILETVVNPSAKVVQKIDWSIRVRSNKRSSIVGFHPAIFQREHLVASSFSLRREVAVSNHAARCTLAVHPWTHRDRERHRERERERERDYTTRDPLLATSSKTARLVLF